MKRQLLLPEGFIYMSPLHNCNVMGTLPLSYSLIPELVKTFLACTRAGREVLQVTSAARSQQAKPLLSWLTLCRGTGTTSCCTPWPWPTAPAAREAGNLQGCVFEVLWCLRGCVGLSTGERNQKFREWFGSSWNQKVKRIAVAPLNDNDLKSFN